MSVFKFKQFEIDQTGCAMKINTDGVLIAALANHAHPKRILDIGTGTGVIALMLAQRFPEANVHAVEIDQQAAEQAGKNFQASTFNNRLSISNISIEQYSNNEQFDLIVSNPPFFVNDLKNEEVRKGIARHADEVFFGELIRKVSLLLSEIGRLWLILPLKQANEVVKIASGYNLYLTEKINICSDKAKSPFRQIICLGRQKDSFRESDFYIYDSLRVHTAEYKKLLKNFFIAY